MDRPQNFLTRFGLHRPEIRAWAMYDLANSAFATTIAERPEDWHMLGRIWSDVPPDPPADGPPAGLPQKAAPSLAEEPA